MFLERVALRIKVAELNHDIPVDFEHVNNLSDSMQKSGQLAPLLLWKANQQIIDGFHRQTALAQAKEEYAECSLIELNEEGFIDARITSAVTHKGVAFPRVVRWAKESFEKTPWAEKINAARAFHLDRSLNYPKSLHRALRETGFTLDDMGNLLNWVRDKSAKWGLTPQQVGNMLDLADLTSPSLVPLVRQVAKSERGVLTRSMLSSIVSGFTDHELQEAIVRKVITERLNESETRELVKKLRYSDQEERSRLLSTSWIEQVALERSRRQTVFTTPEERRKNEIENQKRQREFMIEMFIGEVTDISKRLRNLEFKKNLDESPILKEKLNIALSNLVLALSEFRGKQETIRLLKENQELKSENQLLSRRLKALDRTMGLSEKIQLEEHKLRND